MDIYSFNDFINYYNFSQQWTYSTFGELDNLVTALYFQELLHDVKKIIIMQEIKRVIIPSNLVDPQLFPQLPYSLSRFDPNQIPRGSLQSRFDILVHLDEMEPTPWESDTTNGTASYPRFGPRSPFCKMVRMKRGIDTGNFCFRHPLQWVEVYAPPHKLFGTVTQECTMVRNMFTVRNAKGDVLLRVEQLNAGQLFHTIVTPWNTQVGFINKNNYLRNGEVAFEAFSVDFLSVAGDAKVMLLATALLVHCMYAEGYY